MLTLINGVSSHSPMFGVTDSNIAPNSMIGAENWRQQTFAIRNAKEEYNDCNFSMTGSHYIKIRGNKVSANNTVEIMNIFDFAPPRYTDRAYSHACSPDDIFYYFRPLLKGQHFRADERCRCRKGMACPFSQINKISRTEG